MRITHYVQFYHMSTGYKAGTIPPVFGDEYKKPIEMLGSDGVYILDGRLSLYNKHITAIKRAEQVGAIGYRIVRGHGFNNVLSQTQLYLTSQVKRALQNKNKAL